MANSRLCISCFVFVFIINQMTEYISESLIAEIYVEDE